MSNATILPFPTPQPVRSEVERLENSIEVLRHSNARQREERRIAAIEAEVAILQTYRAWARDWEQRMITL